MLLRSGKARAVVYGESTDSEDADEVSEGTGEVGGFRVKSSSAVDDDSGPNLNAIWNELMSMKIVVEDEHDRKLRRIESDLRWTMTLVGGQFLTIIGSAIAMLAGR